MVLASSLEAFGHYIVTTRSYKVTTFRFSFMNGSSFEPMIDHFGRVCVVAFQIRFRYVSNLVS